MENPFQPNDKVITKFKGEEVEAVVVQTWNKEVQVKTLDGVLRWRTAKTVWYPPKQEQPEQSKMCDLRRDSFREFLPFSKMGLEQGSASVSCGASHVVF